MTGPASQVRDVIAAWRTERRLPRTVVNTLWLGGSSLANGLVGAATSAILARVLGIGDFGVYTLVLSLANLLTDLGDLGMSGGLVRFGSQSIAAGNTDRFHGALSVAVRLKALLGIVIVIAGVLLLRPAAALVFGHVTQAISFYVLLGIVVAVGGIAASVFPPVFQSFQNYRTVSLITIARYLAKLLVIAGLVAVTGKCSVGTALAVELFAIAIFILLGLLQAPVRWRLLGEKPDRSIRREILSFTGWLSLYQVITLLGPRLDVFLVGGLSDAGALGLYSAATKVTGLFIVGVNAYYTVLLSEISSAGSRAGMLRHRNASIMIAGVLAVGAGLVALLADLIAVVLFGANFAGAAAPLRIMSIGLACTVLAYPTNAVLFAMNKTVVFPVMSLVSLVVFLGTSIYLVPRYGATGAAIAFSMNAVAALLVSGAGYVLTGAGRWLHEEANG